MLLTLCCQGQPSIALWPNCLVQFTPTEHSGKWAQHVCQNSPSVHVLLAFKLFLRMIKPVSMLPFCMYAANYSNLTSSLVPSVSAVSSVMWQECGVPYARLRGTDGEWQGRELPSKINRSTVLQLAFQRGWSYALKSLSCLTETRCSIGSDKIRNFIYQATKMVVLSEVEKKTKKQRQEKAMLYVLIQLYWWPWFLMKILITYLH